MLLLPVLLAVEIERRVVVRVLKAFAQGYVLPAAVALERLLCGHLGREYNKKFACEYVLRFTSVACNAHGHRQDSVEEISPVCTHRQRQTKEHAAASCKSLSLGGHFRTLVYIRGSRKGEVSHASLPSLFLFLFPTTGLGLGLSVFLSRVVVRIRAIASTRSEPTLSS